MSTGIYLFDEVKPNLVQLDIYSCKNFSQNLILDEFKKFYEEKNIDTLRAVQKVTEHPGKMWVAKSNRIVPLLPFRSDLEFWHNSQTNTLQEIFVQNASFEIMLCSNIDNYNSITGNSIVPFETKGLEGFDINTEKDFFEAQELISQSSECAHD